MKVTITPGIAKGEVLAPPSKSMAHRLLIGAALSEGVSVVHNIELSEDIKATLGILEALGGNYSIEKGKVVMRGIGGRKLQSNKKLDCNESGSTLRFFIPLVLTSGQPYEFIGAKRLFERPLSIYEDICKEQQIVFEKKGAGLFVEGQLKASHYKIQGNISSQFITGMIFALLYLNKNSSIQIIPPFESKSYINLTISALKSFGANVEFSDENKILINQSNLNSFEGRIEGDYSNAAFLDSFNFIGSNVKVENLKEDSLQGDKIYKEYFKQISEGTPTLDISDCPDLGPILFALAALKNGATFTGTNRLKAKESDRGQAMHQELCKLGGGLIFGENTVTVPKQDLKYKGIILDGHNDHRIVMAMSVILSKTGGTINGAEACKKSYPGFFQDIKKLGAKVEIL